jgi:hypothetical protein
LPVQRVAGGTASPRRTSESGPTVAPAPSTAAGIGDFLNSTTGRQIQRELIRGVFGMLKRKR